MGNIWLGEDAEIGKVWIGSDEIGKIWLGNELLWSADGSSEGSTGGDTGGETGGGGSTGGDTGGGTTGGGEEQEPHPYNCLSFVYDTSGSAFVIISNTSTKQIRVRVHFRNYVSGDVISGDLSTVITVKAYPETTPFGNPNMVPNSFHIDGSDIEYVD